MAAINLYADFFDPGGWGGHARGFGQALATVVAENRLAPNTSLKDAHANATDTAAQSHFTQVRLIPGNPRDTVNWTHPSLCKNAEFGRSVALGSVPFIQTTATKNPVYSTVWETSRVPAHFVKALEKSEQIWVPTDWGREIFLQAGLSDTRISVVPEGVDVKRFSPPPEKTTRSHLRFVCVGKWEERKGVKLLIDAYCDAFTARDDVELIMHCDNPYVPGFSARQAINDHTRNRKHQPPPITTSNHLCNDGYVSLLQNSDVFVLPTRAEAWGLPILEALACGVPAIVTNYSGHLAFANAQNSWLIDVESMCKVTDPMNFSTEFDWGHWATPSHDHLVSLLREAYHNHAEREAKSKAAHLSASSWTWHNAATQAHRLLLESSLTPH